MLGWRQPGDRDRLTAESFGDDGVGRQVGLQPLDRDLAIEVGVGRDPHLGHAALADASFQLVPAREQLARGRLRWGWCAGGHDRSSR